MHDDVDRNVLRYNGEARGWITILHYVGASGNESFAKLAVADKEQVLVTMFLIIQVGQTMDLVSFSDLMLEVLLLCQCHIK